MVEILYQDTVGARDRAPGIRLSEAGLDEELARALASVNGGDIILTPPQEEALRRGLLHENAHMLIAAPTNSGKTLIALMRLFHRLLSRGGRFVYIVPLKALAEEKTEELRAIASALQDEGGRTISIAASTGDYRLTEDFLDSPPPGGEILVCTPERLEVILRNPDNAAWAAAVDTFVLDEFHLLGEGHRGARFETLVTRILSTCPGSTVLALSATVGGIDKLTEWLGSRGVPVEVIESTYRFPQLTRVLARTNDKDGYILDLAHRLACNEGFRLLAFVYRRSDAERLAARLAEVYGQAEVTFFHAGLSLEARRELSAQFKGGVLRAMVTTSSLKMGINTPATHVVVRDVSFFGTGQLVPADVLQMIGRAGRGDAPGTGIVLCSEGENLARYETVFRSGELQPIPPQLIPLQNPRFRRTIPQAALDPLRSAVLSEIARCGETSVDQVVAFLGASYSARWHRVRAREIQDCLSYLEAAKLVYRVENRAAALGATKLGRTTAYTGLSAETGGMLGGFLRALIQLSQKVDVMPGGPSLLQRLTPTDFLFLCAGCFEMRDRLVRIGTAQRRWEHVQGVVERLPPEEKPLVNLWRHPESGEHPTRRLLSSLKFDVATQDAQAQQQVFQQLMTTSVMLLEHAQGRGATSEVEYGVTQNEIEGRFVPTIIWLLNGLAQICSSRRCYRLDFLAIRIYELIEDLTLGASLGKLMAAPGFGRGSAEKLVRAGIRDLSDPRLTTAEVLTSLGLGRQQVATVLRTVRRSRR